MPITEEVFMSKIATGHIFIIITSIFLYLLFGRKAYSTQQIKNFEKIYTKIESAFVLIIILYLRNFIQHLDIPGVLTYSFSPYSRILSSLIQIFLFTPLLTFLIFIFLNYIKMDKSSIAVTGEIIDFKVKNKLESNSGKFSTIVYQYPIYRIKDNDYDNDKLKKSVYYLLHLIANLK